MASGRAMDLFVEMGKETENGVAELCLSKLRLKHCWSDVPGCYKWRHFCR